MSQNEVGRVILSLALSDCTWSNLHYPPTHTHTHTHTHTYPHTLRPGIMVNYYMGKRNSFPLC